MRHLIYICVCLLASIAGQATTGDTLYFRHADRFKANTVIDITGADSLEFLRSYMYVHAGSKKTLRPYELEAAGRYQFDDPGRWAYHPSAWGTNDYMNASSRWSFSRSMESEHFILFWEREFGDNPKTASDGYAFNPQAMLDIGERCFKMYSDSLGFVKVGQSTTDKYKIHMYVFHTKDWKAEGSGYDHMTGSFNVCPWAATSRDGQTVAHEIGHTFQYLVKCDLGEPHGFDYGYGQNASGGNGWWEGCANWQAYRLYPQLKFEQDFYPPYLKQYHLGLMHETFRYQNMMIQDWWAERRGADVIGRLWREAARPEDPIEAYMRIFGLTLDEFAAETYDGFAHMATWDIDAIRQYGRRHIGDYTAALHEAQQKDGWVEVDSAYCPGNFGYNMVPLKVPAEGGEVSVEFKGVAGAAGFRQVRVADAGWRYGFVAYDDATGQTYYGPMSDKAEGTAAMTVPSGATRLWLCVMGAPKTYWRHAWDDNVTNDEQWPWQARFTGTDAVGVARDYGEYPADYQRRDTTVVIKATLARSTTNYSSVRVQYDMDAVSKALGLSTAQMKSVKVGKANRIRFVGVSPNGTLTERTTTTTSSSTCFGHWFTSPSGNVCEASSSVATVFAEFYPEKYGCYVGQYPGRMKVGNTYTIRQAIIYTDDAGKEWRATMEVRLTAM